MYAIICATDEEFAAIHRRFKGEEDRTNGFSYFVAPDDGTHPHVLYVQCGIGKVNAAILTTRLLCSYPGGDIDAVIFAGVAGSLAPDLKTGDILLGDRTSQHDYGAMTDAGLVPFEPGKLPVGQAPHPRYFADRATGEEHDNLRRLKYAAEAVVSGRVEIGTIVTGDVFSASTQFARRLVDEFDAHAVDMESNAVVRTCRTFNVPVYILRSISDNASDGAEHSYASMAAPMAVDITLVAVLLLDILEKQADRQANIRLERSTTNF